MSNVTFQIIPTQLVFHQFGQANNTKNKALSALYEENHLMISGLIYKGSVMQEEFFMAGCHHVIDVHAMNIDNVWLLWTCIIKL